MTKRILYILDTSQSLLNDEEKINNCNLREREREGEGTQFVLIPETLALAVPAGIIMT